MGQLFFFVGAETQFLQYSRAYDLWVRDVNAAGGIMGQQVQLKWYDDFGDGEKTAANYERLIKEDKVPLLLGPCHSVMVEPMAPDGRRRPYRLTPRGRSALRARLQEMREAVSIGLARVVG